MVAVNVDFRGVPTFALMRESDTECTVFSDASEFARALNGITGSQLVTFNGSRYVWPPMLQVVSADLKAIIKNLALESVDVMACFFAEKGFFVERRRVSVAATSTRGSRFPCDVARQDNHASVCTDILGLVRYYRESGRLYWLPKGKAGAASQLKERRVSAWVPFSAPNWLTVRECLAVWDSHPTHPASFMASPVKMRGGMVPLTLLQ